MKKKIKLKTKMGGGDADSREQPCNDLEGFYKNTEKIWRKRQIKLFMNMY